MRKQDSSIEKNVDLYHVLIPIYTDKIYDYIYEADATVENGAIVEVSFSNRKTYGCVWNISRKSLRPKFRLLPINQIVSVPYFNDNFRIFLEWSARYYIGSRGMYLSLALRSGELSRTPKAKTRTFVTQVNDFPKRSGVAQLRIKDALALNPSIEKSQLQTLAQVTADSINRLITRGILECKTIADDTSTIKPPVLNAPKLSAQQQSATNLVRKFLTEDDRRVFLLEGVTGSGKTNVYFDAMNQVLESGQQVLLLAPEITLSETYLERFRNYFGFDAVLWHSSTSPAHRANAYHDIISGKAMAVIGARSAVFLPFKNLGLIVVDEEHDSSYKQNQRVVYNGRDMAIARAEIEQSKVILVSATPTLESYHNAKIEKYQYFKLSERFHSGGMPKISIVDMRKQQLPNGKWLSRQLISAIGDRIERREQSLLFLNRRGYAPALLCKNCGWRAECPNCTVQLVSHVRRNSLSCHHCEYSTPIPTVCPTCEEAKLSFLGPGVERIAEEITEHFPKARVVIVSSDHQGGQTTIEAIEAISNGEYDIAVGTQVLAKGHNFPKLTLVAVVDGDVGYNIVDPRANEKSHQLLAQVVGRAGRFELAGEALIQSYDPDQPLLQTLIRGDSEEFYQHELMIREKNHLPPFGQLISMIVSSPDQERAENYARRLANCGNDLLGSENERLVGPIAAPIAKIRQQWRFRLLFWVKSRGSFRPQRRLAEIVERAGAPPSGVMLVFDVDPYTFL